MLKALRAWNRYKYRFVPWVANNINESSPRVIVPHMTKDANISKNEITETLTKLCSSFTTGYDKQRPYVTATTDHLMNMQACEDTLGFTIEKKASNLDDGGTGVFVSTGRIRKGSVVAIYPGTVYQPWEPVFFISLTNSYLFRCADGVHIDGSKDRLSKSIFNSCAKRDKQMGEFTCDVSWLEDAPLNPLGIGQYVNNQTPECPANVAYQEYELPEDWPWSYRRFIPNVEARTNTDVSLEEYDSNRLLKMVVLVALRDIEEGEELYSSYYTIVYGDENDDGEALIEEPPEEKQEAIVEEEYKKLLQKKPQFTGKKKMRT